MNNSYDDFLSFPEPTEGITPEEGCLGCIVTIVTAIFMLLVCVIIELSIKL